MYDPEGLDETRRVAQQQRRDARQAVMAEREACAALVESFTDIPDRWRIARAIRMRGGPLG